MLLVMGLAVQVIVFALLFSWGSSLRGLRFLFYIPSAWVCSEYIRSLLYGGFTWSLGHVLAGHPFLIQSASWGGVYSVSWLIVFVNTALFLAWQEKDVRSRLKYMVLAVLFLLVNYAVGIKTVSVHIPRVKDPWRVVMLQPNISRTEKADVTRYDENIQRHLALLSQDRVLDGVHLVVWPETAFADDLLVDPVWRPRMEDLAKRQGVYMLIGSALLRKGKDINAALLLTREGVWKDSYEKRHLVPFAEVPVTIPWLKMKLGRKGYDFLAGGKPPLLWLRRTEDAGNVRINKNVLMGVAICSEEAYPSHFREISRRGGVFAVVMLNDGSFVTPDALMLHAYHGIFRAVETGMPVLRVANTGWTIGFDGYGKPLSAVSGKELEWQQAGAIAVDVPEKQPVSFYTRYGDIFVQVCGIFVMMLGMLHGRIRQRSQGGH